MHRDLDNNVETTRTYKCGGAAQRDAEKHEEEKKERIRRTRHEPHEREIKFKSYP